MQSSADSFENRLSRFTLCFIARFACKLSSYNIEAISLYNNKEGPDNALYKTPEEIIGPVVGASILCPTSGLSGASVGFTAGGILCLSFKKLMNYITFNRHKIKAIKVSKVIGYLVYLTEKDKVKFYHQLSTVAVDIFTVYEYQLMDVTCKGGWEMAIISAAYDAVSRIMNYIYEQEKLSDNPLETVLLKGVLYGRSKTHLFSTVTLTYEKRKTFQNDSDQWPVWELWKKPGIIYDKKFFFADGCNAYKHRFRKPFCYETSFPESMLREVRNTSLIKFNICNEADAASNKSKIHNQFLPQDTKTEMRLTSLENKIDDFGPKLQNLIKLESIETNSDKMNVKFNKNFDPKQRKDKGYVTIDPEMSYAVQVHN